MMIPKQAAITAPSLADRPLWLSFLAFAGPMILSSILQALSGTINNVFLGQLIGVKALAAVSALFPVTFFLMAIAAGLGNGASILIGHAFGAGDRHRVKAIAGTTIGLGLSIGAVAAVLGEVLAPLLLRALGTPEDIFETSLDYTRVVLGSLPLYFTFIIVTAVLRGVGDAVTPLVALAVSIIVGLIVSPAFILGWGALPKLGVASVWYASCVAWVMTLVWLALHLRAKGHALAPDLDMLRHFNPDGRIVANILRYGIPTSVQMILFSLAEAVLIGLVNRYGSDATAAYGAVNQVVSYIQFPAISLAITSSIFAAQAIGRGESKTLSAIVATGLRLNLVLTGATIAVGSLAAHALVSAFVTEPAVIDLAVRLLHIMLWSYLLFSSANILVSVMRASGTVVIPTLINAICVTILELGAAYLLSLSFGLEGVWMGYPVAFTAMLLLQAAYFTFGWRKTSSGPHLAA